VSPKAWRWFVGLNLAIGAYWTITSLVRIATDEYPYDLDPVVTLALGITYLVGVVGMVLHYRRTGWGEQDEDQLVPDGDQHQD